MRGCPWEPVLPSEILQVTLDHIFIPEEYPFMCNIDDNIAIVSYDENGSDHDRNIWQVFNTVYHEGMRFNLEKYVFCS